jgi:hypothetical protein
MDVYIVTSNQWDKLVRSMVEYYAVFSSLCE